jgi:hypothetical protein
MYEIYEVQWNSSGSELKIKLNYDENKNLLKEIVATYIHSTPHLTCLLSIRLNQILFLINYLKLHQILFITY